MIKLKPIFPHFNLAKYEAFIAAQAHPGVIADWLMDAVPDGGGPLELGDVLLLYAQYDLPKETLVKMDSNRGRRQLVEELACIYQPHWRAWIVGYKAIGWANSRYIPGLPGVFGGSGSQYERIFDARHFDNEPAAQHELRRMVLTEYSTDVSVERVHQADVSQLEHDIWGYDSPSRETRLLETLVIHGLVRSDTVQTVKHRWGISSLPLAGKVVAHASHERRIVRFYQYLKPIDLLLPPQQTRSFIAGLYGEEVQR